MAGTVQLLLESAGGVDANEVEVLADVLMAGEAGSAFSAPAQRHYRDRFAPT